MGTNRHIVLCGQENDCHHIVYTSNATGINLCILYCTAAEHLLENDGRLNLFSRCDVNPQWIERF